MAGLRKPKFFAGASLSVLATFARLFISSFALADDSSKLSHKFSLRLSGGLGFVTVGDLNTSFKEWALTLPSRTTTDTELGAMKIDCWSMTWEAELRFDLSRKIALGISLSTPFRQTEISAFPLYDPASEDPNPVGAFASDASVDVRSPIRISAYYNPPPFPNNESSVRYGGRLLFGPDALRHRPPLPELMSIVLNLCSANA
jgi:hypothetical protein